MTQVHPWKHALVIFTSVLFSLLGIKSAAAIAAPPAPSETIALPESIAQACPYGEKAKSYSRVVTQRDPLNIRNQPNGRVIGSVPSGWAVVPVQTDASGRWVKINSHFGNFDVAFGSAPEFRVGWVSARYLKALGKFCEKPMNQMSLLRSQLFGQRSVQIQPDAIHLGDQLAQTARADKF